MNAAAVIRLVAIREVRERLRTRAYVVSTGVLNPELFYRANNMELLFVWEKVKRMLPEVREAQKNPRVLFDMEQVANGFKNFQRSDWRDVAKCSFCGANGHEARQLIAGGGKMRTVTRS